MATIEEVDMEIIRKIAEMWNEKHSDMQIVEKPKIKREGGRASHTRRIEIKIELPELSNKGIYYYFNLRIIDPPKNEEKFYICLYNYYKSKKEMKKMANSYNVNGLHKLINDEFGSKLIEGIPLKANKRNGHENKDTVNLKLEIPIEKLKLEFTFACKCMEELIKLTKDKVLRIVKTNN